MQEPLLLCPRCGKKPNVYRVNAYLDDPHFNIMNGKWSIRCRCALGIANDPLCIIFFGSRQGSKKEWNQAVEKFRRGDA